DRINLYRVGVMAEWKLYTDTPANAEGVRRRHIETLLERAELSKAHSGLAWLSAPERNEATGRLSPQGQEAAGQLDLSAARARFDELTDQVGDRVVAAARRRAIWDELMAAQVRARHPASTLPAFQLATVQCILDKDEAVLYYYWFNPQTLLVVGLDRDVALAECVPLDQAARSQLDSLVGRSIQKPDDDFAVAFAAASSPLLPDRLRPLL